MFSRICALLLVLGASVRGAELAFDFGNSASDKIPEGFTNVLAGHGAPGVWKIVMDEMPSAFTSLTDKAPSVSRRAVLAQTSMDITDERFPMLVYTKETFDDFTLTTKFKLVEGVSEQMAGMVFRWQDEKNFYVIRASGLGSNVRFYSVVNGQRGNPIGPAVSVPKGVWHELKIECQGNKIRAWLNGNPVPWEGTAPDLNNTSFRAGKIGFWTKSDSVSHFTDTRITYTPRESPAQVLVRDTLAKYPRLVGLKVYLLDDKGEPRIVGSKEDKDLGEAGGHPEKTAITSGTIFYGKGKDTVSVVQPLRDRNGDPIAAVRLTMTSFLGQTEQSALQRALPIVRNMQAKVSSMDELK
ncbi:MAG TPA: family 16 glycoside hydrolase [Verrucomicrobiae bacterium]|nr:family 16 glycoside hydrolase [Verrucomicrobiae bacterium]